MKKFHLAIVAIAALSLSACSPATNAQIDKTIQASLPKTCSLIETAHQTFTAATLTGKIKQSTIQKENAAYVTAQTFCADPGSVTSANALPLVVQAYVSITVALKAAKESTNV